MVRCRLDGALDSSNLRYVPAAQFDLWKEFMSSHHGRLVTVDEVSTWLPESPDILISDIDPERLEPVVRVAFDRDPAEREASIPVVRFLPYDSYPEARAALLGHFDESCQESLEETPGYFVSGDDPLESEAIARH